MLEYKADLHDKTFITINPAYTTQRFHVCGFIMGKNGYPKLTLGDREWRCPHCGTYHVRDWNAAINIIEKHKIKWTVGKKTVYTEIDNSTPIIVL